MGGGSSWPRQEMGGRGGVLEGRGDINYIY